MQIGNLTTVLDLFRVPHLHIQHKCKVLGGNSIKDIEITCQNVHVLIKKILFFDFGGNFQNDIIGK